MVFKDSNSTTPLIFVLSPGTDPAADLYKFAEEMKFSKKLSAISLGQGQVGMGQGGMRGQASWSHHLALLPPQGPLAEAMMRSSIERGKWVFFQNCHLAPSWMPVLERLIEHINPDKVRQPLLLREYCVSSQDYEAKCDGPTKCLAQGECLGTDI